MSEMLVEVYFEYEHSKNILTKEKLDLLQAVCSKPVKYEQLSKRHQDKSTTSLWSDEDKNHEDAKILLDAYYIGGNLNIVPLHRLLELDLNISFKIQNKIKEIPEYNIEETILHKLLKLESKLNHFDENMQFNTKVGVHISDLGMLNVRHVTWLEDACTRELQRHLDEGWRILAVCPQPNSRRPDYVLGRNDKIDD